ncbi:Cytochrome P450 [Streptomyces zhaozhouensis]|uniref:Cytochrome P450 n=1 Tax=Streptomyces zhaozhouensis TaxID=1300267 RepID=A0A286DVF3_9ACTN|nr:cytochrome P450 [Streptomyces zhaozhouensis]SOD62610.1 Cytochrome P450 [Streptomyces zhaozhouensis]
MTTIDLASAPDPLTVDLTDPGTFVRDDLHEMWARFRAERPVHRHPETPGRPPFWVVTRYADAMSVYKDNKNFTSERGNVLATLLAGGDSAAGKMLAVTDGARHRAIRNMMLKSFSPRALQHVVAGVRKRTSDLIGQVVAKDSFDYAREVAEHIPMGTICDLMAIPPQDRPQLLAWNKKTLSSEAENDSLDDQVMARNEILLYFSDLARHRRRNLGDDVLSTLVTAEIDGERLSEEEIIFNCYSLILGGDESSRVSSISTVLAFIQHPEQWRRFKAGEVSTNVATEEVLRWATPAMHFGRRALVDVEVGGERIAAGDIVTLWNTSANFDESVFPDPFTYDLARTPNKHLTFGYGPHFCLGAFLGREELKALLDELRENVATMELVGTPERIRSNFLYGYRNLPVSFGAA